MHPSPPDEAKDRRESTRLKISSTPTSPVTQNFTVSGAFTTSSQRNTPLNVRLQDAAQQADSSPSQEQTLRSATTTEKSHRYMSNVH
ncbi:hypothetical protein [Bifidobacterium aquikefiricola]|uniref:Uncharacterized protein n=1 Tax=Bifidobacterium aquikefiricola TaxID=3059038 RepID=A0AB39U6N1_9BIFI